MCYNSEMSFYFAGAGFLTTIYIYLYESRIVKSGIHYILLFYTIMELLQGFQYFYVNQCSNIMNKILTEFAYILVLLQPTIWNLFYYANSNSCEQNIFLTAIWLSIAWIAVQILSRVSYDKGGNPQTKKNSVFAGHQVCTKKKLTHLYWEWTSANFGELNANFLTYLLIWFVPALISTKFRMTSVILIVSSIISAIASIVAKEPFTFTSLWCYVSVPITLYVIFNIFWI
jgi:hypothetical protein